MALLCGCRCPSPPKPTTITVERVVTECLAEDPPVELGVDAYGPTRFREWCESAGIIKESCKLIVANFKLFHPPLDAMRYEANKLTSAQWKADAVRSCGVKRTTEEPKP